MFSGSVKREQWHDMAWKLTMGKNILFKNVYEIPQHSAEPYFGFCQTSLMEFYCKKKIKQKLNVVDY